MLADTTNIEQLYPLPPENLSIDPDITLNIIKGDVPGFIKATLPPEGLNVVAWTLTGDWAVYWDNDQQSSSWSVGEKYKPENNEISGVVKVTAQEPGEYACISPKDPSKAILGDVELAPLGHSVTAMPGQYLVTVTGEFTDEGGSVIVPSITKADTESYSVSCISPGYIARVELAAVAEIAGRYNEPI